MRRTFFWSGAFLTLWGLSGCSHSPAGTDGPSQAAVSRCLADALKHGPEPLHGVRLQPAEENRYTGTAESPDGTEFQVAVEVRANRLHYTAKAGNRAVHGSASGPTFEQRYPWAMQGLRAVAFGVHTFGVIWPALGFFGLRRRYGRRLEALLTVCAVINLGLAVMNAYLFVQHWGVA